LSGGDIVEQVLTKTLLVPERNDDLLRREVEEADDGS
jgi:hypothetical protein